MRNTLAAAAFVLLIVCSSGLAHADTIPLVDNGGGLIYDPNLTITWYDFSYHSTSWSDAKSWASGLALGGVSGWRLPTTPGTTTGFTAEGEMGYLATYEIGSASGSYNPAPFTNLLTTVGYWTGTEYAPTPGDAWLYILIGYQTPNVEGANWYALAVHSGDIAPVPIPGAILILGPGLAGLAAMRRRFRK